MSRRTDECGGIGPAVMATAVNDSDKLIGMCRGRAGGVAETQQFFAEEGAPGVQASTGKFRHSSAKPCRISPHPISVGLCVLY